MKICGDGVVVTQETFQFSDGGSIPTSPLQKKDAVIRPISYQLAMEIVIAKHYLHRTAPVSHAFGLFVPEFLDPLGIVTYGVSPSSTLLRGICGDDEAKNVYELNRLWVDERLTKNAESYLVSKSMKFLDREIIVSFADTGQGHYGGIYQACNFYYTGLSTKFRDPQIQGITGHHATYAHGMTNNEVLEKFGDKVAFIERSRKHRYIYFCAKGKRKIELLNKLRYPILPYPKQGSLKVVG
jgi:hypothetical protein